MADPELSSSANSLIRVIESDPLNPELYCRLAELYASARDFRKAELVLRQAVDVTLLHAEIWTRLGMLYSNPGTVIGRGRCL